MKLYSLFQHFNSNRSFAKLLVKEFDIKKLDLEFDKQFWDFLFIGIPNFLFVFYLRFLFCF